MARSILLSALPRWYDLRIRDQSFVLKIHPEVVEEIRGRVERIVDHKKLERFTGRVFAKRGRWGFGATFRTLTIDQSDWLVVECKLPFGENKKAKDCARTLALLLQAARFCENEIHTSSQNQQLLVVTGLLGEDTQSGWDLSLDIGKKLFAWTLANSKQMNKEIIDEMKKVWMRLEGRRTLKHWAEDKFQAYLHPNGGLYLQVPGNAADLCPAIGSELGSFDDLKESDHYNGYCLVPHNIDSPLQQLSLLAGVLKLQDVAGL